MRNLLLALVLSAAAAFAQDVITAQNAQELAVTNSTVVLTVTATSGDGSVCTMTKLPSAVISATLKCASSDGKTSQTNQVLRSTSTSTTFIPWGFGDVFCMLFVNPTTAAVTAGTLGSVPANSIGYSCTSFTRLNGTVSGNTAPSTGSVSWP